MTTQEIEEVPYREATNKVKVRLTFPFEKNAEIKKIGARWDSDNKIWYYPSINGDLPDELKQYKAYKVKIQYEDKEYFRAKLPSMSFDKNVKSWFVNQEDYDKFIKL
jgi:hypothetical protein